MKTQHLLYLHDKESNMDSLISWKRRPDKLCDNDNVSGSGDNISDFDEVGYTKLTGSSKGVSFIMKDETNATAMRKMRMKKWL